MNKIVYSIILFVIYHIILYYDLRIPLYKSLTRTLMFVLLVLVMHTIVTKEGFYVLDNNTDFPICQGFFKQSQYSTLDCENSYVSEGNTYCDCSVLDSGQCTISGCNILTDTDIFTSLWKENKEDACKWASNSCSINNKMFNKTQNDCYYSGYTIEQLLYTPSYEIMQQQRNCSNNLSSVSSFGAECNNFDASCQSCKSSGCVSIVDPSMDASLYYMDGSGDSVQITPYDVSNNLNTLYTHASRSKSNNKSKSKKGCNKLKKECSSYLSKFNKSVAKCYGTKLNMYSYINQNDLTNFDASCSNIWDALLLLQGPCLDGSTCFVDTVTEEQEEDEDDNQTDISPSTSSTSSTDSPFLPIG